MRLQHCTNFPKIAQERSLANIEQKDKIVWNTYTRKNTKIATKVTVKLACDKDIVAEAEYSKSISESDQSAYQERRQSLVILITQAKIIYIYIYKLYFYRFTS